MKNKKTNWYNLPKRVFELFDTKQDKLTAGENVSIVANTINVPSITEMLQQSTPEEINEIKTLLDIS